MKTKKKDAYCSIAPVYPKEGYVVCLFIFHDEKVIGTITLESVYESYFDASADIEEMIAELDQEQIQIPYEAVLLPVTFHSLVPLKKEYWTEPSVHYSENDRSQLFTSVILYAEFYHLLVTPTHIESAKKTYCKATLPLKNPEDLKQIESFMYTSDQVVDLRASHAAIYSFGKKLQYNWKTQIVTEDKNNEYTSVN